MGIGLHGGGLGVIKFLHQSGAKIIATDLRSKKELKESLNALKDLKNIEYVLGEHREQDFKEADLIIKNPAVPDDSKFLQIAKDAKVPIETDIGIFFELCEGAIIGVTGSRGKSTTASLIHQFLLQKYPDAVLAGNIRTSVLEKLERIKKDTLVVLELSSWQLNGLVPHKKSPHFSVITNVMPDHQNRYESMEHYIADKKAIFQFQNSKDFLIANYDDEKIKSFAPEAKSKIYYFSKHDQDLTNPDNLPENSQHSRIGAYANDKKIFFGASKEEIIEIPKIRLAGKHNLSNVLAAVSVARIFDISTQSIKKVLGKFSGLQGRMQFIKEVNGVKYINDTTSTIPEATIAAINTLIKPNSNNLILIAGGADKNLNFQELAKLVIQKAKAVFLLEGTATEKLEKEIKKELLASPRQIKIEKFNNLERAITTASRLAKKGDIVLLSPASASFGMFRHEFERGEKFNQAVGKIE